MCLAMGSGTGDWSKVARGLMPPAAMVLVQVVFAGVNLLYKLALNDGMDVMVLVAYRYIFAAAFTTPLAFFIEREEASQGSKAPIDPFTREQCKPSAFQGVSLGGMGSGCISRGFRGEFKHWQIVPGSCETSPIFVSREGGNKKYSSVLAPGHHEGLKKNGDLGISSWDWNLTGQHSTYHALFPRAWTVYDGEPDPNLKISCRQISPFIPHNYRESSLPTAAFVYTLVNTGRERAKVSLLMTWANSIGGVSHYSGGHINEPLNKDTGSLDQALSRKVDLWISTS